MNVGQQFSHYLIEEKIGEGDFGVVFRARDLNSGMDVAIKCSHPDNPETANDREQRFLREVACISKLHHPNIIQLYDYGTLPDRTLFLVMEYINGFNLADLIRRDAPFSYVYASDIILQVLDALAEAHAQGVIHRDLKPANIMLVRQGLRSDVVKLLDFGIAKSFDGSVPDLTNPSLTKARGFGTPQYMPPEQFYGQQLGPHSDLYAVGLVFLEMLTGKQAVGGNSLSEIVNQQINGTIVVPEPFSLGPLGNIFRRSLAKNIEARYASAAQMYQDVDAIVRFKSPFLALYSSATAPSKEITVTFSPSADNTHKSPANAFDSFGQDDEMATIDNSTLEEMQTNGADQNLVGLKTMIFDDGLEGLPDINEAPQAVPPALPQPALLPPNAPVLLPKPGMAVQNRPPLSPNVGIPMPNPPRFSQANLPNIPHIQPSPDLPPTEIGDVLDPPPDAIEDVELMIPTDDASRVDPSLAFSSASTCPLPAPNLNSRGQVINGDVNSGEFGIKTSAMPSYSEMLAARGVPQNGESDDLPVIFHEQSTKFIQNRHMLRNIGQFDDGSPDADSLNRRFSNFIDDLYEEHFGLLVAIVCLVIVMLTLFLIFIVMR